MSTFLFLELKLLFVMIFSINTSLQNILHRMLSWHGFYFCYFLILFNFLCMKTEMCICLFPCYILNLSSLVQKSCIYIVNKHICRVYIENVVYFVHLIFLSVVVDSTSDQCCTKDF